MTGFEFASKQYPKQFVSLWLGTKHTQFIPFLHELRMCNWATLAEEVLKAELPSFETVDSMSVLLQLERDPPEARLRAAAAVLGRRLDLPQAAALVSQVFFFEK